MPLFQGCWQLDNFYKPADFARRGLTDCYFYYYSTCKNGNSCQYRHEPLALGHEVMCSRWLEGHCDEPHCRERHMIIGKRRDRTDCFWENTPFGCTKPHCVFRHNLPKNGKVKEILEHESIFNDKTDKRKKSYIEKIEEEPTIISTIPSITITNFDSSNNQDEQDATNSDMPDVSYTSSGFQSLIDVNLCESEIIDLTAANHDSDASLLS